MSGCQSSSPNHTLRIWDTNTGEQLLAYSDFGLSILAVAWSPDGNQVIGVTAEGVTNVGNTIIIDIVAGESNLMSFGAISDIQWSPDGSKVALANIGGPIIVDATNFQPLLIGSLIRSEIVRPGLQRQLVNITWSPDSTRIAGGMGDGRVFMWELDNPDPIFAFIGHDYQGDDRFLGWIHDLRFDDAGQMLTTVSGDGTIRTWDLNDGSLVAEQITSPNYAADFSPYGAQIALGLAPESSDITIEQSDTVVIRTLADDAVQIVVPSPSLESLQAIIEACNAPAAIEQMLIAYIQTNQITEFIAQIEALLDDTIPSACRADVLAVAEALQVNESLNTPPTADAGADQILTADANGFATVTLDGSASFDPDGEILSYVWTLDGVEIATGAIAGVQLGVGVHEVMLTVTDDDGAVGVDSVVVTVE